jgi:hypothetical protein
VTPAKYIGGNDEIKRKDPIDDISNFYGITCDRKMSRMIKEKIQSRNNYVNQ